MTQTGAFDPDSWKRRAWGRLLRAVDRGVPKREAEARWTEDMTAGADLSRVVSWCRRRGIDVVFETRSNAMLDIDGEKHTIRVSSRASPRRQLAYVLHEVGHYLVAASPGAERYASGYPGADHPSLSRTLLHRFTVLEEEFEAWHRGWKLAEGLSLSLPRDVYDAIRVECLKTHVAWAARRGS